MRTAEDATKELMNELFLRCSEECGTPGDYEQSMIVEALTAFRNDGIEEAAKEAALHCVSHRDYETGTDNMIPCELPERIRALKK